MDELKKHIQQNADRLNVDEPSPLVWERVSEEVRSVGEVKVVKEVKMVRSLSSLTKWAAAACVFVLAGLGIWFLLLENKPIKETAAASLAPTPVTQVPSRTEPAPTEKTEAINIAQTHNKPKTNKPVTQPPTLNSMELGELHELEYSFSQVINLQRARISSIPMYAETPDYFKDFKTQLKQIEKDEKGIKSDISHNGMNGELLDQLINLYQQKLSVLKQLQLEMNKTNNRFKQNREPVDSTKSYFIKL